jgi:hypothetical protein
MNPIALNLMRGIAGEVVKELLPEIIDLASRAVAGEDISHHELMDRLPGDLKITVLAKAKMAQREAAGLPL